jgi:molybdenum cofactor biosynthesis protein B
VAVLTVSDTRTLATDTSGAEAAKWLATEGHRLFERRVVPDDPEAVRSAVMAWLQNPDCDAVITTGGTGLAPRDRTYEAVAALLERRLDGFGELFRALSYAEIGSAAMLSRAVAGIVLGKPLFSLPGSTNAVRLAMEKLVAPELSHLASILGLRP